MWQFLGSIVYSFAKGVLENYPVDYYLVISNVSTVILFVVVLAY